VQNIDLAPTLAELARAQTWESVQGLSLVPLLQGEPPKNWREAIYYRYYEYPAPHRVQPHRGLRTERYRWIEHPLTGTQELYDLESDPTEMHNRAKDPELRPSAEGLQRQLALLRKEYGDN
jgi:arylsulfatase A-like enzyme